MCPDNLDDLREWLHANGGFLHPALVRDCRDGLAGIFTDAPIAANEKLVETPKCLMIGPHLAPDYPALPQTLTHERDIAIFIFLSELEKGERSRFHPWLVRLPTLTEFESYHPLFAGKEEWDELESILPRITKSLANFKMRILEFHSLTQERFALADVAWAMVLYLSRAFEGNGWVPVGDFFNHDARRGRGLLEDRYLAAGDEYAAGDQIFINYGATNDTLENWLTFGFWDRTGDHTVSCAPLRSPNVQLDGSCYLRHGEMSGELVRRISDSKTRGRMIDALANEIPAFKSPKTRIGKEAQAIVAERLRVIESNSGTNLKHRCDRVPLFGEFF